MVLDVTSYYWPFLAIPFTTISPHIHHHYPSDSLSFATIHHHQPSDSPAIRIIHRPQIHHEKSPQHHLSVATSTAADGPQASSARGRTGGSGRGTGFWVPASGDGLVFSHSIGG